VAVCTKWERMACWRVVVWAAVEVEACVVGVSLNHVLPCEIHLLYMLLPRKRRRPPSHLLSMVNCLFWWYEGCSESNAPHFFSPLGNYLFRMYEIHARYNWMFPLHMLFFHIISIYVYGLTPGQKRACMPSLYQLVSCSCSHVLTAQITLSSSSNLVPHSAVTFSFFWATEGCTDGQNCWRRWSSSSVSATLVKHETVPKLIVMSYCLASREPKV